MAEDGAPHGMSGAQMTGHLAQGLGPEAKGEDGSTVRPADSSTSQAQTTSGYVHNVSQASGQSNCFDLSKLHPSVLNPLHSVVAAAFKKNIANFPPDMRFLMDTGCGFDLISEIIARIFQGALSDNPDPITLHTANATTFSDKLLSFKVPQYDEVTDAVVLADTPSVLSLAVGVWSLVSGFIGRHTRHRTLSYLTVARSNWKVRVAYHISH